MRDSLPGQPKPKLDSVTLLAVTSVAISQTVEALRASKAQADFAQVLLLSDSCPDLEIEGIRCIQIPFVGSRVDYSRFMLRNLADYITTDYALCVQWDGFVVNGAAWDRRFLDYDYIGAVWPHFHDGYNVGNGGFSLRSRRLLQACAQLPLEGGDLEDVVICRTERPRLEKLGIRFAPEDVAQSFSYERTTPSGTEFGFHGSYNLVRYLSNEESVRLFRSLEPAMLARNERWELFRWAIRHGRLRLALELLKRLGGAWTAGS